MRPHQGHQQSPRRTPILKPSSNSVLPVAWTTRPPKDLRQVQLSIEFSSPNIVSVAQIGCHFLADERSSEFSNILIVLQDPGVQVSQIRDVVIY